LGGLGTGFWEDTDADGFVEGEEYAGGTDPRDALSKPAGHPATPKNLGVKFDGAGNARVAWDGSFRAVYELWVSGDFIHWDKDETLPVTQGDREHAVPIDRSLGQQFFRLLIDVPVP
jgi:hypothetical protein